MVIIRFKEFSYMIILLDTNPWIKIQGLPIMTFGFLGGHSIASSWGGGALFITRLRLLHSKLLLEYSPSLVTMKWI